MNKRVSLFAAAFLLIAACLVLPKIIATQYEEGLANFVGGIDGTEGYTATVKALDSGWFGSEATVSLAFDLSAFTAEYGEAAEGSDNSVEIELLVTSHYGPLLFSKEAFIGLYTANIQLADGDLRSTLQWDQNTPFYQLDLAQGLIGGLSFSDRIPAFSNEELGVSFSGYEGEGDWVESLSYKGEIYPLELAAESGEPVLVDNIVMSYRADVAIENIMDTPIYDSDLEISIEKMDDNAGISLENFSIFLKSAVEPEQETTDISYGITADMFTVEGYTAREVSLQIVMAKLNNQVFHNLQQLIDTQESKAEGLSEDALFTFFSDNVASFFATNPELNLTELKASLPEGRINMTINSKLAEVDLSTNPKKAFNPYFWVSNGIVHANIEVGPALAEKMGQEFIAMQYGMYADSPDVKQHVNAMLQGFVQQGAIKFVDGQYVSELSIEKGRVTVSDMIIPLF